MRRFLIASVISERSAQPCIGVTMVTLLDEVQP